jgi:hypothetical protein
MMTGFFNFTANYQDLWNFTQLLKNEKRNNKNR